jgi:hypothetical protein
MGYIINGLYTDLTCAYCGKSFVRLTSQIVGERNYCCRSCRNADVASLTDIACRHCGKIFQRHTSQNVGSYCSRECYNSARHAKVILTCSYCGVEFTKFKSQVKNGPNYCSRACMYAGFKSRRVTLTCEICQSPFEVKPNRVGRAKTCSAECVSKLRARAAAAANSRQVKQICAYCKTEFSVSPSRIESEKLYCSQNCYWADHVGEKSPRWRGGTSDRTTLRLRSPSWKKTANSIRSQRGNVCEVCGYVGSDYKLSVHHIVPWEVSQDDSPENLLVVCKSCHPKLEALYWSSGITPYISRWAYAD